jgi:transposase
MLTGGDVHDIKAAPDVLAIAPAMRALIADKGYDGDAFRELVKNTGAKPVIPFKSNRKKRGRLNRALYKSRNTIERCFCRLKDFRRIATRYDKLARNYLAAVHLAAVICFWLN